MYGLLRQPLTTGFCCTAFAARPGLSVFPAALASTPARRERLHSCIRLCGGYFPSHHSGPPACMPAVVRRLAACRSKALLTHETRPDIQAATKARIVARGRNQAARGSRRLMCSGSKLEPWCSAVRSLRATGVRESLSKSLPSFQRRLEPILKQQHGSQPSLG